jgi:hypothetical protein
MAMKNKNPNGFNGLWLARVIEGICILANTSKQREHKWNADVNTAMVVNMNNILKYVTNT